MTEQDPKAITSPPTTGQRQRKFLLGLLAAGGLLVAAAGCYLHFTYNRSIGRGPAGLPVAHQDFARPWTTQPMLLVGLGDSVTAGFGARRGYAYFDRLAANPPDEFPDMKGINLAAVLPHLSITNLSVSGSVSAEVVDSQLPRLPQADTNTIGLVVLTTGGNDLIHNYGRTPPREHAMYGATMEEAKPWIEHFEQRLDKIVQQITNRFPGGCQIFLANIYDPTDGVGDIAQAGLPAWPDGLKVLQAYNAIIHRCAEKHAQVHLVNFHDAFLGHGLHCNQFWAKHYDRKDPHYWYYTNLEDPNERGYDAIRRLFLIEMAKAFTHLSSAGQMSHP